MSRLDDILKTGFGWISPKGNVASCKMHEHFKSIRKHRDLSKELKKQFKQMENTLYDCEMECQDLEDEYGRGHGEWHNYELMEAQLRSDMWSALIQAGWVRFGEWSGNIEFQGIQESLDKHNSIIYIVAREIRKTGCDISFEIREAK